MIGKILGNRYEILSKLGGGGMAVVYKARCTLLNRIVSIKVLREQFTSDEAFVNRFRREAQAVASLCHPNIVAIYDVGQDGDLYFLVMEYVEGRTLKELIQERAPLAADEVVAVGKQICDALAHAHNRNIVHRDIKPHNILITADGRVKVTDFGIARAVSAATFTHTDSIVGSVHYFSPEQAKGEITGAKSDLYSLGVVLYEMATGKVPFDGESPIAVALKHIQAKPAPPTQVNFRVPLDLERIILRAMEKIPALRYSLSTQMRDDLEKATLVRGWNKPRIITAADAGQQGAVAQRLNGISKPVLEEQSTQVMPVIKVKELEPESEPEEQGDEIETGKTAKKKRRRRMRPAGWVMVILVLVLALWGAGKAIDSYFNVAVIKVPDVTGKPEKVAISQLKEAGLEGEILRRQPNDFIPKGTVVTQDPQPHEMVKKSRIIYLVASSGPSWKKVPDVVGLPLREAGVALNNAGFQWEKQNEEYSNDHQPGSVVSQQPVAKTDQPEGTIVFLTVSKGPETKSVVMPNLVKLTLEDAKKKITEVGLELGTTARENSSEFFEWQVIRQDIPQGTEIIQGERVSLVVSQGPGPVANTARVQVNVPNDGVNHQIRIMVIDAKGEHQEYNQTHAPGEVVTADVPYFGAGKIQVFVDDNLTLEQPVGGV